MDPAELEAMKERIKACEMEVQQAVAVRIPDILEVRQERSAPKRKGLFETTPISGEIFDECDVTNLTNLPTGLDFERPLEDLPFSLENVKGTPEQITAVGECLAAAKDAPATFSLPHLLGFTELCTAALRSADLSLDLAMGIFHATKAMIDGRAVNVNRLGPDYGKLDAETRRELASIQVNGV